MQRVLLLTFVTFVFGCGDDLDRTYPISANRPQNATCRALPRPPQPGRLQLEPAFTHALRGGSRLDRAIELAQSPADADEWFLIVQGGQVLSFSSDPNESEVRTLLDLRDRLDVRGPENGLVSFALHPDFDSNGHIFVTYMTPSDDPDVFLSRVSRFTRASDGTFPRETELIVLDVPQRANTHSGNHIAFGNDGFLFYSVGDDLRRSVHGQDPSTVKGALLRIDVNDLDPDRAPTYAIPADNPFATDGMGAPEVYAYGLRNPWRFTIDTENGEIFLGDVGQDRREEINRIVPAGNYGWPLKEGTLCFQEDPCDIEGLIDPIVELSHSEGRSVVAGFRYRSDEIAGLLGRYLFADFVSGNIFSIPLDEEQPPSELEWEGQFSIVSFAQAQDGALYAVRYSVDGDGGVYRISPTVEQPDEFPRLLSETGCADPADPRQPAAGLIPYEPIAPLWSDGSEKDRYFAIPDDRRLVLGDDGDFDFPVGSVLIKHFRFGDRYHETRLLMRDEEGWAGYSYEWNEEQTDARLLDSARTLILPNGVRWVFPSRSQCMECHTEAAGRTLGLEVMQLNHRDTFEPESPPENQLTWLLEHDFFVPEVETLAQVERDHPTMVNPTGDAPVAARARSYLHANCSMCHRPGGPGRGEIDLRFTTSLAGMNACNEDPRVGRLWDFANYDDQQIIRAGTPDDSTLYMRLTVRGIFRMPPIASEVVDEAGSAVVRDWIAGMDGCD